MCKGAICPTKAAKLEEALRESRCIQIRKRRIRVGWRYETSWNDQPPKLKDVQNVGRQAKASLAPGLRGSTLPATGKCTESCESSSSHCASQRLSFHSAKRKRKEKRKKNYWLKFDLHYEKYMFQAR